MYTIYNRIDVHLGLLKQGQKRISDSKQVSMCIAHRSKHNAKYARCYYLSFHNLGDVTALKKGPNQGRAFRHSL